MDMETKWIGILYLWVLGNPLGLRLFQQFMHGYINDVHAC